MRLASMVLLVYLAWTVGREWPDTVLVMTAAFGSGPVDRCQNASQGMATVFGFPGDRHAGGDALGLGRPVDPDLETGDLGVAHRSWSMGDRVRVCYRGRCATAEVIDRGPYGCDLAAWQRPGPGQRCHRPRDDGSRWCLCTRPTDRGTYRGCLDMTPRLRALLGHPGRARVTWQR